MNDKCVFCKIARHEMEHYVLWEDDEYVMFLSKHPVRPGHTLIIPKAHTDYFFDIDEQPYHRVFAIARWFEPFLRRVTKAERIGLAVEGFGVGHAHLHAVPLYHRFDLFTEGSKNTDPEELEATATLIRAAIKGSQP